MKTTKKLPQLAKNFYKLAAISSLLIATSCSDNESISDNDALSTENSIDLSSKSVELGVSSYSASSSHSSYPVRNAFDGSTSTRWTGNGVGTTLNIDLGSQDAIDYLKIAHHKGNSRVYSFEVYTRESTSDSWTKVGTKSSPGDTNSLETYDVTNSTARYIKVVCNGNTSNNWSDITEIEVYGTAGDNEETCVATEPSGRSASTSSNSATLSWNAVSGIDHYNVRYKPESSSTWSYKYTIRATSVTASNLSSNTDYEWQIRAKCSNGDATNYTDAKSTFTTSSSGSTTPSTPSTGGNPSSILDDLDEWKITFPVDEDGDDSSNADDCDDRNNDAHEIRNITGSISSPFSNYFFVSGDEVVFKAHVGGATTSGSNYPRCELRQTPNGGDNYWDMDDYQFLDVRVRVTSLPDEKPEVSMVQIHGPDDEPLRVEYRADSQGLHVVQNEDNTETNVLDYSLGQQLRVTVTVDNGDITCRIENESTGDVWSDTWEAEDSTGYFKVGCYTQSSNNLPTCKPGEGFSEQDADEYGEVRVKDMSLTVNY